jgi:hypothetical protein
MRRARMALLIVGLLLWLALAQLRARPAGGRVVVPSKGTSPLFGYLPTALIRSYEPPTPGTATFWLLHSDGQLVAIYLALQ